MKKTKGIAGFTLIELMIVVAVVGILAAIAYPSYTDSIRKARRTDAETALMEAAQKLEAYYASNASYTKDLTKVGYAEADWNDISGDFGAVTYRFQVNNAIANCPFTNCFRMTAQSQNNQADDKYDRFRLWSTGRKQKREKGGAWSEGWSG